MMILLQSESRYLLQILTNRVQNLNEPVKLDFNWVEFDDIRYNIQSSIETPHLFLLSLSLATPPPQTLFSHNLPLGAIDAVKAVYGLILDDIINPPKDTFNLTLQLNLSKLPSQEDQKNAILSKIASIRNVVMGAPLRLILKRLASRSLITSNAESPISFVHRPNQSFFVIPHIEKVNIVFPMRFNDSIDTVLATSFLQEFVEARRGVGLNNAPSCTWSSSPPSELKDANSEEASSANAGFVSFVISPRHVEGKKLDKTVWNLSTFHAYVNYHVKCSEGFMHTRMRRRVETLIQALDRARPDEDADIATQSKSFKRLNVE